MEASSSKLPPSVKRAAADVGAALLDDALSNLLPETARLAVRAVVAQRLRAPPPSAIVAAHSVGGGAAAHTVAAATAAAATASKPVDDSGASLLAREFADSLATVAVQEETQQVVLASLRQVAAEYARASREARLLRLILDDVLGDLARRVALAAQSQVASEGLVDFLLLPQVSEVVREALADLSGAETLKGEAVERQCVREVAAEVLIESALLERLAHTLAARGETLLLARHAGQMLDAMLANMLMEHVVTLAARERSLEASPILTLAHRTFAAGAVFDDMVDQLEKVLPRAVALGDAALVPAVPVESDDGASEADFT